jgi:hypothetical protein
MGDVEQRTAYRFPTNLEAECRMTGQAWSARLRNISTTGCMMACPDDGLPDGWMMRLRVKGLPVIDAEIVWRHRGHVGLHFLMPLCTSSLEHLGYRLPDSAEPCGIAAKPPAGLHPQLVKRSLEGAGQSATAA